MSDYYSTSFMLLLVGMITVFVILAAVVIIGKLIIYFVNQYFPEDVQSEIKESIASVINGKKLTALVTTVDIVTGGTGKITKIEKK